MEFKLISEDSCTTPKLQEILPGTLIRYQNHTYLKLDKSKFGEGIVVDWPKGHSILLNPRYGSLRAVIATTRVTVLKQCSNTEVCKVTDRNQLKLYLRSPYCD